MERFNFVSIALVVSALTTVVLCVSLLLLQVDARNQRGINAARQNRIVCLLEVTPEERTGRAKEICADIVKSVR